MFRFLVVAIVLVPFPVLFLCNPTMDPVVSQVAPDTYELVYLATFKPYEDRDIERQLQQIIFHNGDSTIAQWSNQRKLDSISSIRKTTDVEWNAYPSSETYVIEINRDYLTYTESKGGIRWIYKEELSFNWQLENEQRSIKGYDCKKATLDYGGRSWTAWYAVDLPLNVGPYKFKGLPGMIVKITDSKDHFDFELSQFEKTDQERRMTSYQAIAPEEKSEVTTRAAFNKFKTNYTDLSFNEKMNYLNRDTPGTVQMMITNVDGSNKRVLSSNKKTKYNLIEVVED